MSQIWVGTLVRDRYSLETRAIKLANKYKEFLAITEAIGVSNYDLTLLLLSRN